MIAPLQRQPHSLKDAGLLTVALTTVRMGLICAALAVGLITWTPQGEPQILSPVEPVVPGFTIDPIN